MSRKIVIIPGFAESHLLKYLVPNIKAVFQPDLIIYNEGLFYNSLEPAPGGNRPLGGPESKTPITREFLEKWTLPAVDPITDNQAYVGFDIKDTFAAFTSPVDVNGNITPTSGDPLFYANQFRLHAMSYAGYNTADKCALRAYSYTTTDNPANFDLTYGDYVIFLEPDAFHLESQGDMIRYIIEDLKPGEGLQTKYVDFLETQYYTEAINLVQPKYRRFAYRYDNWWNYREAIDGFTSQDYPALKKVDEFFTYHYAWFRPSPWKELRYELIHRSDPKYWRDFESGLQEIRKWSESNARFKTLCGGDNFLLADTPKRILIRPSRTDEARWAEFIYLDHPIAIQNHPNFVKVYND